MINTPKRNKILNIHYSLILHGCINIRNSKDKFKNFQILLGSGCISTILTRRLVEKLHPEKYALMQWHTQAGNIITNIKVKVYFTLPAFRTMNVVT